MGPRSIDRGTTRREENAGPVSLASMGPRSIDRGTATNTADWNPSAGASMGPRSIDRGTSGLDQALREGAMLQWGRDQLIAELAVHFFRQNPSTELQWGRDQLIAELQERSAMA